MKNLLLTGFGPFAEHSTNPTEALVMSLNNRTINGYKIFSCILPVEYSKSINVLEELIEKIDPNVIINLGLAADRSDITPELIAVNYQHSETKDNAGTIRQFSKINPNGKESFFSTLPIKEMIDQLKQKNISAKLSSTAGTYVCNTVMYHCLKRIQQDKRDCRSGFIHIPNTLSDETLVNALTICISTL